MLTPAQTHLHPDELRGGSEGQSPRPPSDLDGDGFLLPPARGLSGRAGLRTPAVARKAEQMSSLALPEYSRSR